MCYMTASRNRDGPSLSLHPVAPAEVNGFRHNAVGLAAINPVLREVMLAFRVIYGDVQTGTVAALYMLQIRDMAKSDMCSGAHLP